MKRLHNYCMNGFNTVHRSEFNWIFRIVINILIYYEPHRKTISVYCSLHVECIVYHSFQVCHFPFYQKWIWLICPIAMNQPKQFIWRRKKWSEKLVLKPKQLRTTKYAAISSMRFLNSVNKIRLPKCGKQSILQNCVFGIFWSCCKLLFLNKLKSQFPLYT